MTEITIRRIPGETFVAAVLRKKGEPGSGLTDVLVSPTYVDLLSNSTLRSEATAWSRVASLPRTAVLLAQPIRPGLDNENLHEFYNQLCAGKMGVFLSSDTRLHIDATRAAWPAVVSAFFGAPKESDKRGRSRINTLLLPPLAEHITFNDSFLATQWYRGALNELGITADTIVAVPVPRPDIGTEREIDAVAFWAKSVIESRQGGSSQPAATTAMSVAVGPIVKGLGRFMASQVRQGSARRGR